MSQLPLFRSVVVVLFGSTLLLGGCAPEGLGELDPTTEEVTSVDAEIRARPETPSLETSVNAAVAKHRGAAPEHGTFVDVKRMDRAGRTAFGSVAILAPVTHEEGEEQLPEGMLWAAVRSGPSTWEVYLEHSPEFNGALETLSAEVMGKEEKAVLRKNDFTTQGDASANLSLPWAPGQSWNLRGGPHGWGGSARPWSALDLNGGDGRVLAAREGFVYKMCGTSTWLQVRHSGGWATDYYHLANMVQFTDGTSIERGRYLGNTGTTVACGGSASGPHVHFNLRLNGAHVAMNGREMGGWTFWEGAAAYQGFAERSGVRVGVNSLMYNPGIQYQANVEGIGWQGAQANGGTAGTTGQSRRLEAINISLQRPTGTPGSFDVCYEAHVQNIGWQGVRCNAQTAGTVGQGLRMEALKIWLVNPPNRAGVCYRANVQNIGWQPWVCNGAIAGTTGQSLRIEALQIKLTP